MDAELIRVEREEFGAALLAPALVGDHTLTVSDASELPEEGGEVAIGDVVYPYTKADHDSGVITLASTVTVAASTDDPVRLLTVIGEPAEEWTAWVRLADNDDPYPASIPSTRTQFYVEGDEQAGATLTLDEVDGDYEVASRPQHTPYMARRATAASIATSTWTPVTGWTDVVSQGLTVESNGSVTITYPGFYAIDATPAFASNSTGARYGRIMVNGVLVGQASTPGDFITFVTVMARTILNTGDNVVLEVQQTSGASLDLHVGVGKSPFSIYRISV